MEKTVHVSLSILYCKGKNKITEERFSITTVVSVLRRLMRDDKLAGV